MKKSIRGVAERLMVIVLVMYSNAVYATERRIVHFMMPAVGAVVLKRRRTEGGKVRYLFFS